LGITRPSFAYFWQAFGASFIQLSSPSLAASCHLSIADVRQVSVTSAVIDILLYVRVYMLYVAVMSHSFLE
jgi:hypothetical protein